MGLEGEGIVEENTQISSQGSGVNFNIANFAGGVRGALNKFGVDQKELRLIVIQFE